jgi:hypothetical protein
MLRPSAGTSYAFTDAASLIEVLQTVSAGHCMNLELCCPHGG